MIRIWAIARHTMAESFRMKLALVFVALLALIVLGLPFSVSGDGSLTGTVQAFMSYALSATGLLLGILTIFLSRSLADELVQRQVFLVLTKPVPRWQYVLGKWLGITLLNVLLLGAAGFTIYGMVYVIRHTRPVLEERFDEAELINEVLVARHALKTKVPYENFSRRAEQEYQRNIEEGMYDNVLELNENAEKARLRQKYEARWRILGPRDMRVFEFENVLVDRRAPGIQIRYKTEVSQAAPDEIFRALWVVGDQSKGTAVYRIPVRHVIGRYHAVRVPADAVARDHTLTAFFYNQNPYEHEVQANNIIEFRKSAEVEVLFAVGSFEGNLLRLMILMLCKLMFLASVSIMMVTVFSFPVACMVSFTIYAIAGVRAFLAEAFDFASLDQSTMFTSVKEFFLHIMIYVMTIAQWIIPDLAKYDGVETLVGGRNVGLVWVLNGVFWLGLVQTGIVLGMAMLLFHRREVAEVSV